MRLTSVGKSITRNINNFGVAKAAYNIFFRAINRCIHFKIVQAIQFDAIHLDHADWQGSFQWQFFTEDQLRDLAQNPANDIDEDFLAAALARGDQCYGALDGQVLASYTWYSDQPTEVEGAVICFPADRVYVYKAFTLPEYRGKRLHALGMSRALREYVRRGYAGFVSCVESHNFSSQRSFYRFGFRDCGKVLILKLGQRRLIRGSRRCLKAGVVFAAPGDVAPKVSVVRGSPDAGLEPSNQPFPLVADAHAFPAGSNMVQAL